MNPSFSITLNEKNHYVQIHKQDTHFKIYLTLISFTSPLNSFGNTVTCIAGNIGDWNDATNWSGGSVPTISDDVIIPSGSISFSVNTTINSLIVGNADGSSILATLNGNYNSLYVTTNASLSNCKLITFLNLGVNGDLAFTNGEIHSLIQTNNFNFNAGAIFGTLVVSNIINWTSGTLTKVNTNFKNTDEMTFRRVPVSSISGQLNLIVSGDKKIFDQPFYLYGGVNWLDGKIIIGGGELNI